MSGIFWALACLVKLYGFPVFAGFLLAKISKKQFLSVFKILVGFFSAFLLFLLPFLVMNYQTVLNDLVLHHLHHSSGLNKINVFGYFLKSKWFLILFALVGMIIKPLKKFVSPVFSFLLFLILFQDLYYNYLLFFLPFLIVFSVIFMEKIWYNKKTEGLSVFILVIYVIFIFLSWKNYALNQYSRGQFKNVTEIANYAKNLKDFDFYGSHEIAPLIALMGNKKIYHNYIDTNTQTFTSGAHNLEKISQQAIEDGIYLIARISRYPEYNIKDTGFEGYFKKDIFEKYCNIKKEFSSTSREQDNLIVIYFCQRK